MSNVPTIRINMITHAQAIRLPGHEFNSVQIDAIDEGGQAIRIVLAPPALKAMIEPLIRHKSAFGLDGL